MIAWITTPAESAERMQGMTDNIALPGAAAVLEGHDIAALFG